MSAVGSDFFGCRLYSALGILPPMNRLDHQIEVALGKAALKTHALQTLRDRGPNRAKRLECVRFIGAFGLARMSIGSCS